MATRDDSGARSGEPAAERERREQRERLREVEARYAHPYIPSTGPAKLRPIADWERWEDLTRHEQMRTDPARYVREHEARQDACRGLPPLWDPEDNGLPPLEELIGVHDTPVDRFVAVTSRFRDAHRANRLDDERLWRMWRELHRRYHAAREEISDLNGGVKAKEVLAGVEVAGRKRVRAAGAEGPLQVRFSTPIGDALWVYSCAREMKRPIQVEQQRAQRRAYEARRRAKDPDYAARRNEAVRQCRARKRAAQKGGG